LVYSSSSSSNCNRCGNKPRHPSTTVPKKEIILVLPYLGVQSKIITKQLKTCSYHRIVFQSAYRIKSLFLTKIGSTVPNCQNLCIGLVVGTARISTLEKQNVGCVTEKLNITKPAKRSRAAVMLRFFFWLFTYILLQHSIQHLQRLLY